MSKTKLTTRSAVKATKVQLRLRPAQKAMLARAAELRRTSLSNFMLQHACEAAQQLLPAMPDLHFLIMGYPGVDRYQALASSLGIASDFHQPGLRWQRFSRLQRNASEP